MMDKYTGDHKDKIKYGRNGGKNLKMIFYIESISDLLNKQGYLTTICYAFDDTGCDDLGVEFFFDAADTDNYIVWLSPMLDRLEIDSFPDKKQLLKTIKEEIQEKKSKISGLRRQLSKITYTQIKDEVQPYFVKNIFKGFLKKRIGCPHRQYVEGESLTIAYYVKIHDTCITINNAVLSRFGADEEILYQDSLKNIQPVLKEHNIMIADKTGEKKEVHIKILTNKEENKGAIAILLIDLLENLADRLQTDLYIIVKENYAALIPLNELPEDRADALYQIRTAFYVEKPIYDEIENFSQYDTNLYKYRRGSLKIEALFSFDFSF